LQVQVLKLDNGQHKKMPPTVINYVITCGKKTVRDEHVIHTYIHTFHFIQHLSIDGRMSNVPGNIGYSTQLSQKCSVFLGIFIAEEVYGVGVEGSGDTHSCRPI
jgi:hypothetical protein